MTLNRMTQVVYLQPPAHHTVSYIRTITMSPFDFDNSTALDSGDLEDSCDYGGRSFYFDCVFRLLGTADCLGVLS